MKDDQTLLYHGMSDASTAVFLNAEHFVVADDETNVLRIYHINKHSEPAAMLDVSAFLNVDPRQPEADIEAAERVGERIYWITSHGRNKDGKIRSSRYRLFCTKMHAGQLSGPPELAPDGTVCSTLTQQLLDWPFASQKVLVEATRINAMLSKQQQQKLAPKRKGLNIEGLTFHPGRESLLIGLRNPLYALDGKTNNAIVIELKNPADVIEKQQAAEFGNEMFWDLGGRGIRGMEYSVFNQTFYILAGPVDSESNFALYRWDGRFDNTPKIIHQWPRSDDEFTPEGIAVHPEQKQLWVFSDDGAIEVAVDSPQQCMEGKLLDNGRCLNKHLINNAQKTFRVRVCNL